MSGNVVRTAPPLTGSTAYINARIVDPIADKEYFGAVLISDGRIADFGPNLFTSGAPYGIQSIDCGGLCLSHGIVDTRVHTGEPGEEHKETLESAGIAAAAGGITSMVLLPDNDPPFDDASLIEFVARRAFLPANGRRRGPEESPSTPRPSTYLPSSPPIDGP